MAGKPLSTSFTAREPGRLVSARLGHASATITMQVLCACASPFAAGGRRAVRGIDREGKAHDHARAPATPDRQARKPDGDEVQGDHRPGEIAGTARTPSKGSWPGRRRLTLLLA